MLNVLLSTLSRAAQVYVLKILASNFGLLDEAIGFCAHGPPAATRAFQQPQRERMTGSNRLMREKLLPE